MKKDNINIFIMKMNENLKNYKLHLLQNRYTEITNI